LQPELSVLPLLFLELVESREVFGDVGVFSPRLPEFAKDNSAALPFGMPSLVVPAGACCRVGLPMLGADRRASICFEFREV